MTGVIAIERRVFGEPLTAESNVRKHLPEALQYPNGRAPRRFETDDHIAEIYSALIQFYLKGDLVGGPVGKRPVIPIAASQSFQLVLLFGSKIAPVHIINKVLRLGR